MSSAADPLRTAHRRAYGLGLALCGGTPGVIAVLLLAGVIPPGTEPPEGIHQQIGYLFTGLVFLSAAWVLWRSGQVLRGFSALAEAQRPLVLLRECLLYAAVLDLSSLCGLAYWSQVGSQAGRHAWSFILLTPALFLALVPREGRWRKALEG
ncbi:MAG: hypothetical protein HGB30_10265 [Holophagaceae bacterium]|nr:hypothetical protein [Holophagaceae bacterium]